MRFYRTQRGKIKNKCKKMDEKMVRLAKINFYDYKVIISIITTNYTKL